MAAPDHDWYLAQWIAATGTRQARIVETTGYAKGKVSKLVNGRQTYDRQIIDDIARALSIEPFELLMHPADAMSLRRLRNTALQIASDNRTEYRAEPPRKTA